MKKTAAAVLILLMLTLVPFTALLPKAGYAEETEMTDEITTDISTAETTEEETDGPFIADISFDGEDEVGDSFSVSVYTVADDLRGGTMVISYDTAILSDPETVPTDEEGVTVTLRSAPGRISVLFITDESFYGYLTLLTLNFTVVPGASPETVQISLENIVLTDGSTETKLSGVTYVAAYAAPVITTDTAVTDTEEPVTDGPVTETDTEPQTETEPVTREPVTTEREPITTRPEEPTETEPAAASAETFAQTQTETETETDTAPAAATSENTETQTETAAETEEAVITEGPGESAPEETEGKEEKRNNSFIIPAAIVAAALAFAAATAVYFVKKTKKTDA